jgi:hypothetical protein
MKKTLKLIMLKTLLTTTLTTTLFAQGLPRLAVAEFTTNVDTTKARADSIAVRDIVESEMTMTGKYTMVTRNEIDQLLANQRIQMSEITSAENIQKLEIANIKYIVTGSVNAMDNDYSVIVRVLDVANGIFSHQDRSFMGNSSRELNEGITVLMQKFVAGMATDESGAIVQTSALRAQPSGISIEVSTKEGGDLYFQGERVATLFVIDTHTIPIERPGTYVLELRLLNGNKKIASVTITARGVTRVDFSTISVLTVGSTGPSGGIVFFDKGSVTDGWRYLEAAPASTEFEATWDNAISRCRNLNYGGFNNWRLPTREELDLMYKNLKQKGLGGFADTWY